MSLRPVLFTTLAVVLFAAVVAHRFAPEPSACVTADQADVTGLYQQALTRYAAVLDDDAGERCAQAGLLRAVSERCTSIGILAAEGAGREARKAYMSILALDLPVAEDADRAEAIRSCAERGMRSYAANPTSDTRSQ